MSKKEEALRRSVLSREGPNRDRAASRRAAQILATAGVLAMGAMPAVGPRVDYDAERGRFSSGDLHPDQCSCAKCSAWRRAERTR